MKKVILLHFLIMFAVPCVLFSGVTGKIAGKIVDKATGEPLPGVNVIVDGTSMGAATDLNGEFFIINVPPGVYDLKATYIGYKSEVRTLVRVWIDKTSRLDLEMTQSAVELGEINVVAYREDGIEKDVTATKLSYDVGEIEGLPGISDVGDILNLQADVDGGHFRGSRSGEALYLVSGASIVNPLTNSRAFQPMTIGLEQVEVYTSGFSAEYGNVQSGVINMVAKEGPSAEWETHFDVSTTNSYYKTHGGSVFSEDYIDYFEQLNSTEEWAFGTDPVSGALLWSHFGLFYGDRYMYSPPFQFPPVFATREDTLRTAELIRILWLQSVRDIGLEYDKPDYRIEFSSGGPIAKDMTFFVAAQQNIAQPFLPTGRPDVTRQVTSNITYKPNAINKIQLLYNYATGYDNSISNSYTQWFERTLNVTKETNNTHQFAVSWNRVLNQSTFFDIKLSQLFTKEEEKVDLLGDSTLTELYTTQINWRDYTAPTGYEYGGLENATGFEKTKTFTINSSITSQVNQYNLLKAGLQFNYYDMDVGYFRGRSSASQVRPENYKQNPYEGAFYFQDKMEYEGMIANIGARLDYYNFNTDVYTDKFSPFRNETLALDKELANTEKSDLRMFFQPRVGVSFPVSEDAVVHLNYGVFTQRPPFNTVFAERVTLNGEPERIGNAELEPERTISYDVGLVHGLPFGFYLDVSAYLKDISNLLQFSVYQDNGGNRYFTFDNREYANVKGFQVNLEKKGGTLRGYMRYNWESAKGKSGSAIGSGARTEFFEDDAVEDVLPSPEDIFLDYNRKHKLVGNVSLNSGVNGVLGIKQLSDISVSATYRLSSGRPFTFDPTGQGLQMNQRTPTEHDLKLRLTKGLKISSTDFNFYFEVYNALNDKVFDYNNTFAPISTTELNPFAEEFVQNRESLLTLDDFAPYLTSLEGYLYGNQPRHYRFGVELDF